MRFIDAREYSTKQEKKKRERERERRGKEAIVAMLPRLCDRGWDGLVFSKQGRQGERREGRRPGKKGKVKATSRKQVYREQRMDGMKEVNRERIAVEN